MEHLEHNPAPDPHASRARQPSFLIDSTSPRVRPDWCAGATFIGRETELGLLHAAFEAAGEGNESVCLVTGEAGIGKTRLLTHFASRARVAGATVLWGRCSEDGAAPVYWPWIQILRAYARSFGVGAMHERLSGAALSTLGEFVPDIVGREEARVRVQSPHGDEPDRRRFRFFDAVATLVCSAPPPPPLVLVLDDLHEADLPSLTLLRFVAQEAFGARVLLVASCREFEMHSREAPSQIYADLIRLGARVDLRGLTADEAGQLVNGALEAFVPRTFLDAVYAATDGNPFFIDELLRLLGTEGHLPSSAELTSGRFAIPDSVREVIRRRVAPLPVEVIDVLRLAAVIGREFDFETLRELVAIGVRDLLALLGEAAGADVIVAAGDDSTRYAFTHALVRETLYEDLSDTERVRLHRRVGLLLENRYDEGGIAHFDELAHHFLEAACVGESGRAIRYAELAAQRANALLAHEDAADKYERALRVARLHQIDERKRCELLLALGESQDSAGFDARARSTFEVAASSARRLHCAELLARAALGWGGRWALKFTSTALDKSSKPLLEEALAALDRRDSIVRSKLLARFALAVRFSEDPSTATPLAIDAIAMARRVGDVSALAYVLCVCHAALLGPDDGQRRLAIADEIAGLATQRRDGGLALRGHTLRAYDLAETGDVAGMKRELTAQDRLAAELGDPFDQWLVAVTKNLLAIAEARLTDADSLIHEACSVVQRAPGQQSTEENAGLCFAIQTVLVERERGSVASLVDQYADYVSRYPEVFGLSCLLAWTYFVEGRRVEAQREIDRLAVSEFAALRRETTWLASTCMLAEVCAWLDDQEHANALRDRLAGLAGRMANLGSAACYGSTSRYLGLLCATLDRYDDAVGHFEAALRENESAGFELWLIHTQMDYASMLGAMAGGEQRDKAIGLLEAAHGRATRRGMTVIAARSEALLGELRADAVQRTDGPRRSAEINSFRREGEYWTIVYAGRVSRLNHIKGMLYLEQLLRRPGREVHATELAATVGGSVSTSGLARGVLASSAAVRDDAARIAVGLGDAGEILDESAIRAYRTRVEDLRAELAEAQRCNDIGRAERVETEMRFLTDELAAAIGIGGRRRRAGSVSERARVNVTRALKTAIGRMHAVDPVLGEHLARYVRTGTFCAYDRDPDAGPSWEF